MLYDNDKGLYHYVHEYIDHPECDWYDDEEGLLYIIPPFDVIVENEGPDNEIMDTLNAISRANGRNPTEEEAGELGLVYVDHVLRRFHPEDGYYHT